MDAELRQRLDAWVLARWEQKAAQSVNPLLRAGRKYFSQNDEDGILLEILRRIGLGPGRFLEIGVGNGLENNSLILLMHGWQGAWIGGDPLAVDLSGSKRLTFSLDFVTPDNVVPTATTLLAKQGLALPDVDVASVDIDSFDRDVVECLLRAGFHPRVLVVEYNAKFPPPVRFSVPFGKVWRIGSDYMGCSLQSWCDLLVPAGYQLVACNVTGCNAFFVQNEEVTAFQDVPTDVTDLFMPAEYQWYVQPAHRPVAATIEYFLKN